MNRVDRVVEAVAETARHVEANIGSQVGADGGENPSGEAQIAADVWADRLFFDALAALEGVGEYVSEERESAVDCGTGYSVAIDPLDGSSNLASNNVVGTIVGVYEGSLPAPGRELVAAVMVLYGPYTTMTVARTDERPQEYLLREGDRESRGTVSLPDEPTVVGLAGRRGERGEAFDALADDLAGELKLRYGGATVGDLAQVLEYGGLFGYPASTGYPDGKLRVHFEAAPLAYIVEAAGGESTDGRQSLLDVDPEGLHARTPTFLGDPDLVGRVESALGD